MRMLEYKKYINIYLLLFVIRCGLHADFTELTACVGGELDRHEGSAVHRRYFYITLLREPVARYLHTITTTQLVTLEPFEFN